MAIWRKFETEEVWKARPHIGDPGYSIDDLALKPDGRIGLETRRGGPHRHFKSVNVVDLVPWLKKERDGRPARNQHLFR